MKNSMNKIPNRKSRGFTIIEMMITLMVMLIVSAAIGIIIIDNQKSWGVMYAKINSDIVSDGFAARNKFNTIIRNASSNQIDIDESVQSIEINYYANSLSSEVDRYGKFFVYDNVLYYEYGKLEPREKIAHEIICGNVSKCMFKKEGSSAQMILTLDDGVNKNNIVTSAITHN